MRGNVSIVIVNVKFLFLSEFQYNLSLNVMFTGKLFLRYVVVGVIIYHYPLKSMLRSERKMNIKLH